MKKQIFALIIGILITIVFFELKGNFKNEPLNKDIILGSKYGKINYTLGEEILKRFAELEDYKNMTTAKRNEIHEEYNLKRSGTYLKTMDSNYNYCDKMKEIAEEHLYNTGVEEVGIAFDNYEKGMEYVKDCYKVLNANDDLKYYEYYNRAKEYIDNAMRIFKIFYEECDSMADFK